MADTLPLNFPLPTESAVASYNWTDVADSTGYITFYAFDNEAGAYTLTQNANFYSKVAKVSVGGAGADSDEDFDITFANTHTIKGDLLVGITYYAQSGNNETVSGQVKVKIVHYDGTTPTVIGTQQTSAILTKSTTGIIARRTTFKFSITGQVFKSGDTLRINVVLAPGGSSASASNAGYYFDPANRDIDGADLDVGTTVDAPTQLTIEVPFRIDL